MHGLPPAAWLIAAILYVLCPLDLDFVPIIGWIDDVVVAYIGIRKWREGTRLREAAQIRSRSDGQRPTVIVESQEKLLPTKLKGGMR